MSNIKIDSLFEDLSGVNAAKAFPQSLPDPETVFDYPAYVQEYDSVENELENTLEKDKHTLYSLESIQKQLLDAKAICRQDAITLESFGSNIRLLPLNTYTKDYSRANYSVTLENLLDAIGSQIKKIATGIYEIIKSICKFFVDIYNKIVGFFTQFFKDPWVKGKENVDNALNRVNGKLNETREEAIKDADNPNAVREILEDIEDVPLDADESKLKQTVETKAKAIDLSKKDKSYLEKFYKIRKIINREFNDLKSVRKDHNLDLTEIVNEMIDQRLNPFYKRFFRNETAGQVMDGLIDVISPHHCIACLNTYDVIAKSKDESELRNYIEAKEFIEISPVLKQYANTKDAKLNKDVIEALEARIMSELDIRSAEGDNAITIANLDETKLEVINLFEKSLAMGKSQRTVKDIERMIASRMELKDETDDMLRTRTLCLEKFRDEFRVMMRSSYLIFQIGNHAMKFLNHIKRIHGFIEQVDAVLK